MTEDQLAFQINAHDEGVRRYGYVTGDESTARRGSWVIPSRFEGESSELPTHLLAIEQLGDQGEEDRPTITQKPWYELRHTQQPGGARTQQDDVLHLHHGGGGGRERACKNPCCQLEGIEG